MEEVPKVKRRLVGKQDIRTPEQKKIATIEKVYYDNETCLLYTSPSPRDS